MRDEQGNRLWEVSDVYPGRYLLTDDDEYLIASVEAHGNSWEWQAPGCDPPIGYCATRDEAMGSAEAALEARGM
jgi:hypothetical protein